VLSEVFLKTQLFIKQLHDLRLLPWLKLIIPSSGSLCIIRWFKTHVSGLPIGTIFKGQALQNSLTLGLCSLRFPLIFDIKVQWLTSWPPSMAVLMIHKSSNRSRTMAVHSNTALHRYSKWLCFQHSYMFRLKTKPSSDYIFYDGVITRAQPDLSIPPQRNSIM
jgi:hypothetical protein